MQKCPECGNSVSQSAATCPHCGRKLRTNYTATGILATLIIGYILVQMGYWFLVNL